MKLDLKKVIEVLAEFNVKHDAVIINDKVNRSAYGLCMFDNNTIYVAEDINHSEKLKVIIHELLHAYKWMKNVKDSEKKTKEEEDKMFKELFGNEV